MKKNVSKIVKKDREYANILGINVIGTTTSSVLTEVEEKVSHNSKFYIVTPNPELVLMAQRDKVLKKAINEADFALADGIGLSFASMFLYGKSLKIIRGRDLFLSLMKLADKNSWKVFFLGGENGEAAISATKMSKKYKKVKIKAEQGPKFNNSGEPATGFDRKLYQTVVKKINSFAPELLIVGFSDPKEEKWVYKNHNKLNIGGAAAFGGTFRYIAGLSKLPPEFMEKLGLEWLWRLLTEPRRINRVLRASVLFPLRVLWYKITGK